MAVAVAPPPHEPSVARPPPAPPRAALPPGPSQPAIVQALRYISRYHAFVAEQHARFGPSWTLRLPGLPPAVITTDRDLIRTLVTGDPLKVRHANDILAPALGEESVLMLEPAPHLIRRKLLLPPYHGERMASFAGVVREIVDAGLDAWPGHEGGEVGVHRAARSITFEVIQRLVLGTSDPEFARETTEILDTFASAAANLALFAPALARRTRWNVAAEHYHRKRDRMDAMVAERISAARADPHLEARTDVLALLVQARDEHGRGLADTELNDELKTQLIAGHETTATAIAWAADILAHNPWAQDAIRTGDRAYVTAAAKEVLRLRTVAPITVSRTVLAPVETADRELPTGTTVLADALTLHADPELHPDPTAFDPARFLDGGPPPYSYLPFGGGARRCLGATLASLELETALRAITERFVLSPAGPPESPERRGPTLVPKHGANVLVRAR